MSAPFMPLYVADYLADTTHLTRSEHGAYLLLLMAMWRGGGKLPADDGRLAAVARCSPEEWAAMRATVLGFFQRRGGVLRHKRLGREYARYADIVEKRREAGKAGAAKKASKTRAEAAAKHAALPQQTPANPSHNQSQTPQDDEGDDGCDPLGWPVDKRQWAQRLMAQTGCFDGARCETPQNVDAVNNYRQWHEAGVRWETVIDVVREVMARKRGGLPSSMSYFARPIALARASRHNRLALPEETSRERRDPVFRTAAERNQEGTVAAFRKVFGGAAVGAAQPGEPG